VHHRDHLRARLVDLAVNEALGDRFLAARVERPAVEVVLEQVVALHALGRERAREEVALPVRGRAQADVPVGVDHAVLGEDAVGGDEVVEVLHQSALMPASLTTRFQRLSSRSTRAPRTSGGPPAGDMPCLASASRTPASCSAAFTSALIFITSAGGVAAGPKTPYQVSTSSSRNPCSRSVGTSGIAAERS